METAKETITVVWYNRYTDECGIHTDIDERLVTNPKAIFVDFDGNPYTVLHYNDDAKIALCTLKKG